MNENGNYSRNRGFIRSCLKTYYSKLSRLYSFPPGFERVTGLYAGRDGKFLRPHITLMVLKALGEDPEKYRDLVGAMELMETTTISFDDIIDDSPSRRGGPSTHVVFGKPAAYLAFQAAYLASYGAFWELKLPSWRKEAVLYDLTRDIFLYFFGQNSELYWSLRKKPPAKEQYLGMSWDRVRFLSFNAPFTVGAHLGGVSKARIRDFRLAGSWLGMAYHLHGDELNLFPRSQDWGKQTADDISAARYTYIILLAMQALRGKDSGFLRGKIGAAVISKKDILYLQTLIRKTRAVEQNREMADLFYKKYEYHISKCFRDEKTRAEFLALGRYMCHEREK